MISEGEILSFRASHAPLTLKSSSVLPAPTTCHLVLSIFASRTFSSGVSGLDRMRSFVFDILAMVDLRCLLCRNWFLLLADFTSINSILVVTTSGVA